MNLETHKFIRVGKSSSRRSSSINHEMVQAIWGIHPTLVKNTVECTMRQEVRISCSHPLLTKRIQTNDRMLCYNRLPCNFFADTLISGTVSTGETNMRKFLLLVLVGHKPTQRKIKVTRMKPYPFFFSGWVCQIRLFLMYQRNRSMEIFRRDVWKQGARWKNGTALSLEECCGGIPLGTETRSRKKGDHVRQHQKALLPFLGVRGYYPFAQGVRYFQARRGDA